jgi:hypothetical protein
MSDEVVRVIRVIEYEGPREWVEEMLSKALRGEFQPRRGCFIRANVVGPFRLPAGEDNVPWRGAWEESVERSMMVREQKELKAHLDAKIDEEIGRGDVGVDG